MWFLSKGQIRGLRPIFVNDKNVGKWEEVIKKATKKHGPITQM